MRHRRLGSILGAVLVAAIGLVPLGAATAFAHPAFQAQWQQGEGIAPNFWGPLGTAHGGQQEPYAESPGGQRLVQYFDKGRMELANSAIGTVTSGLLATDLTKGQIQVGDAAFQAKPPPALPIAGDPDNPGPTYAGLAGKGASLFAATTTKPGAFVTLLAAADGTVTDGGGFAGISMTPAIGGFDATTRHNVLGVFSDYRDRVGLATIGLAISEPFRANVKVAGVAVTVLVQVFERRVLTYTATNPDPFKVEMGNIGQHYYQWRYGGAGIAPAASPAPAPAGSYGGKIAYSTVARGTEADHAVFVMNPDGSGRVQVGNGITPQFSPDGKRVAYYTYVDEPPGHYSTVIRSVALDGSGTQDLGYILHSVPSFGGVAIHLRRWSPDGRSIVFTSTQNVGAGAVQLFDVASQTPSKSLTFAQGNVYGFLDWFSSGGGAIWQASKDYPDKKEIYLGDPAAMGSNAAQITGGQNRIGAGGIADWFYADARVSPDGRSVAIAGSKLLILPVPGQQSALAGRSFDAVADATSIAWSPDGRAIAATLGDETNARLVIMDVASGNVVYTLDGAFAVDWSRA